MREGCYGVRDALRIVGTLSVAESQGLSRLIKAVQRFDV